MLTLKFIILAFLIAASGGSLTHSKTQIYLRKHPFLRRSALFMGIAAALYFVAGLFGDVENSAVWLYQRLTIGRYLDREYSIAKCDKTLRIECIRYGGIYGEVSTLAKIRSCSNLTLLPSSHPPLKWISLWITNIYSYAPGGGGPGGGLIDGDLKVGGWGDWYFSLIKFELPTAKREVSLAAVLLFVQSDEQETIPIYIDRIIEPWKWDLTQHIWWKDRPGGFPVVTDPLAAPSKTHWYVIEITKLYGQWAAGTIGNFGFQIRPSTNYGSIIRFTNNLAAEKTKIPYLLLCEK